MCVCLYNIYMIMNVHPAQTFSQSYSDQKSLRDTDLFGLNSEVETVGN